MHVRIRAEVAQPRDHPVRACLAKLRRPFSALLPVRSVLRVGPIGPGQQGAILEGVEAAAVLANAAYSHGADIVRSRSLLPTLHCRNVVPVHCSDVVAVGTVLALLLPVAIVDRGRRPAPP